MPEKINWNELHTTRVFGKGERLAEWLLLHSITISKKVDELVAAGCDLSAIEVSLLINGTEVPFIKTLSDIEKQLNYLVNKRAAELIRLKYKSMFDKLNNLHDVFKEAENKARDELGVPTDEW